MSSDGDDQRIFLGFKFSILGFLGGGKIWQVFFWGGLIYVGIILENFSCGLINVGIILENFSCYFGNF